MKASTFILLLVLPALMALSTRNFSTAKPITSTGSIFEIAQSHDNTNAQEGCNFPQGEGPCPKYKSSQNQS